MAAPAHTLHSVVTSTKLLDQPWTALRQEQVLRILYKLIMYLTSPIHVS